MRNVYLTDRGHRGRTVSVMTKTGKEDPVWQQAVEWTMREHDGTLDEAGRADLLQWLAISPQHGRAYQEAARLWLITGLVPPSEDVDSASTSCRSEEV